MTSPILQGNGAEVFRVLHPCLQTLPGAVPLDEARLTDRRRLAVLLQAAGLLSVLVRAGWRLADPAAVRVTTDGRLVAGGAEPGRSPHAQEVLCELLDRLSAASVPDKQSIAICAQAETLIELCRESCSPS